MKKLKYVTVFLLLLCFAMFSAACGSKMLDTPTGFNLDDAYTLYWKTVTDARSYELEIKNVASGETQAESSHRTYISLAELPEGNYEIKVRAVGGVNNELFSQWSSAVEFERARESGFLFELINGNTEYAVTKVGTASGEVVMESYYRGKPVTTIAENAFRGKGSSRLESVVIGSNIRAIGEGAFYNCTRLQSVTFPESVQYIGQGAFQGCNSLQSVTLPAGLTEIPAYMFAYCRGLQEVNMGDSVAYIGESAFFRCSSLAQLQLPDSVLYVGQHAFEEATDLAEISFGSGIQAVDEFAFYSCTSLSEVNFKEISAELVFAASVFRGCTNLAHIELPEGLTEIGSYAFYECSSLGEVTIPESVAGIGEFAFRDTALYKEQSESGDGFIYADKWLVAATNELKLNLVTLSGAQLRGDVCGIADQAFVVSYTTDQGTGLTSGPPKLETVEIPASVRHIGIYAFYKCPLLNKVTAEVDSQLKTIDDRAFEGCAILRNVQFREGLEDIGSYAFKDCTMLLSNDNLVPSTVKRIGTYAFNGSGLWTEAAENGGVAYATNWVVGTNELSEANITLETASGEPVAGVADFAFYKNEIVASITGLSGAKYIGRGAFFGCTALSTVILNNNLRRIEDNTFSDCTSLFIASLPLNLESIGLRAFYKCTTLNEIDFSNINLTEVGEMAFYGCFNVKEVNLGTTLKTIGPRAFSGLNQIVSLNIPNSVESIGDYAFSGCEALESITFGAPQTEEEAPEGTSSLAEGEEESALTEIGAGAFYNCTSLTEITFPENLESIGDYAFYKCASLKRVHFGSGLKHIGNYGFATTPIFSLVLPAGIESIGDYAFKNCKLLQSVIIAGTPAEIGVHAFYGSNKLTFYVQADSAVASTWNRRWNSAFRPVIWNSTLSETEDYLVSFTVQFENVTNPFARFGVAEPMRAGYHFVGWALSPGGEAVLSADEWRTAEMGTVLYAVWEEGDPPEPEIPQPEPELPEQSEQPEGSETESSPSGEVS